MTPAKRRPATAASEPTRTARKVNSEEAPPGDAGGDPAPPTEAGQDAPEDGAKTQSPARSSSLHPERVWPD